jgi:NAD(P)-dependent dehydrogenase (short-subunit alcohol dehydrogenase family)
MSHAHASSSADLNPGRLFDCSRIVALVTGGATGIGEMAASGLIQGGAKVIIASRKESELKSKSMWCITSCWWMEAKVPRHGIEDICVLYRNFAEANEMIETSDRLNKLGPGKCSYVSSGYGGVSRESANVLEVVADLKDKKGCDDLVAKVKQQTDRLTVLVNNTGATWGAPYGTCNTDSILIRTHANLRSR